IVLVIIGALFNRMAACLWVIAVLSNVAVIQRIRHTYHETRELDHRPRQPGDTSSAGGRPSPGNEAGQQPDQREGVPSTGWPSHNSTSAARH
ncbi:MAG: hypothetical protein ACRD1Y_14360, partial [Terriglobales bacterium]